jgi:hypothetical protein
MSLLSNLTKIRDEAEQQRDIAYHMRDMANDKYRCMLQQYAKDQELFIKTTKTLEDAFKLLDSALNLMKDKKDTLEFCSAQQTALSSAEALSETIANKELALKLFETTKADTLLAKKFAKSALIKSRSAQYALIVANHNLSLIMRQITNLC